MRRALAATVAALSTSLVLTSAASAAVTNLELVVASSPTGSSTSQSISAQCEEGKQVLGSAGGKSFEAGGQVRSLKVRPNVSLTAVRSSWREDQTGYAGNWGEIAYALCADPLVGTVRVTKTSPRTSAAKSVVAACPAGKKVVGVGGAVFGGVGQVVMDAVRPEADLLSATVEAREDRNGFSGDWSVSASVVCARPPQGLQRAVGRRGAADVFTDVVAECPNGKGLVGTGGEIFRGLGRVSLETYVSPPAANEPPDSTYARGWQDETEEYYDWSVTSYAICANVAYRLVDAPAPSAGPSGVADVTCPDSRAALGGGADINNGVGQVHLTQTAPGALGDTTFPQAWYVAAREDVDGFAGFWAPRAFAICSTPLPGLEIVQSEPSDAALAVVSCPAGKRVTGAGGFSTSPGTGGADVYIEDVALNPYLTNVIVHAPVVGDGQSTGAGRTVTAYAVCANPPPGLQLVTAYGETDSDVASAKATCPSGKHVTGGGGAISGGGGQVILDDLRPEASLRTVTVTGIEDQDGFGGPWSPTAHAICANY